MNAPLRTHAAAVAPGAPGRRRFRPFRPVRPFRRAPAWAGALLLAAAPAAAAQDAALTAAFESVPASHDGAGTFAVELVFDAPMAGQTRAKVESALRIEGAELARVRALSAGVRDRWRIRLRPVSDAAVTLTLQAHDDCEAGPCSADGRALARSVSVTVPGP